MDPALKAALSVVLGLAIVGALGFYLVVTNVTQRLDDAEAYKAAFDQTDAYARIHDAVLADETFDDETSDLLGDVAIADQDDVVDVMRQVFPPDYLREQTEANIDRFTAFLRHERDDLAVYVELQAPLARIEPAVLGKVDQYIVDEIEIEAPQSPGCSPSTVQRMAIAYAERYTQLSEGTLPLSVPSLNTLPRECRRAEFDRWFDVVRAQPSIDPQTALALQGAREAMQRAFIDGDTRGFLKAAAEPIVTPQIDVAIADMRQDLQPNDRFDLLESATDGPEERAELDEQAEALRDGLSDVNGLGRFLALAMVVVAGLLLAAVHLPRPDAMLRWPGVALLVGGGLSLVAGLFLNSGLPAIIREIATEMATEEDAPVAAIELAGDLLEVFAREVTSGFMTAAVAVIVVGVVLVAASVVHARLASPPTSAPRRPGARR